ncbi:MAG: MBL fold metallo-hydrolase [Candidatus Micrarchaeales archaeon]|jgi:L-ascorbate metabolism protein UlaG (beta-lactamase superfamily)|uniref:Metal dependent hydrolase n=1 Tax=Candidatus Micrarchaeum acidiphilum ARMAN-2 TaxID=425595 RepID=C7DGR8_MICA2|nr:MAG: putative metal dependent hydrolase [Candidatus Micrarchaeum acidiphilum ARMAN-2]MCW6161533.1 MBL fold metallo-hydrolase [Candidatus Micrarchaeales archaeon]
MDAKSIKWIGHAGFFIECGPLILAIDPFRVESKPEKLADIVLVTHPHFDHCSREDIIKVAKRDATIIAPKGCIEGDAGLRVEISKPGFKKDFEGLSIEAVPAYNTKPERLSYHPRSNGWVGYVVGYNGARLYHAGDTDAIPEMAALGEIEYALLPIGGTYTMDVEEAIGAAKTIGARHTVPMHYKNLLGKEGSKAVESKFRSEVEGALIMPEIQKPTYSF